MNDALKSYAETARCCAVEKAQNDAFENIRDMNVEMFDWTPTLGMSELEKKVEGIKAEADLLLSRVRPLVEER